LRVSENKVLKRIFGPKRDKVSKNEFVGEFQREILLGNHAVNG
jgi:hypothetical protein